MGAGQVHVCIDVHRDGDTITGTVTAGGGVARAFSGRLGLFTVIDDAIESIAPQSGQGENDDVEA